MILVGALGTVDLLLTIGVIKRLREHTELLATMGAPPAPALGIHEEPGDFEVSDADGRVVRRDALGDAVVAFFSPTCKPCKATMPAFVEYARAFWGGRDQVLAVVVGDAALASDINAT